MFGQDAQCGERPQTGADGARESDLDRVSVGFGDDRKRAIDAQQLGKGRSDLWVQCYLKGKEHIIDSQRGSVGKAQALAEMKGVTAVVLAQVPG